MVLHPGLPGRAARPTGRPGSTSRRRRRAEAVARRRCLRGARGDRRRGRLPRALAQRGDDLRQVPRPARRQAARHRGAPRARRPRRAAEPGSRSSSSRASSSSQACAWSPRPRARSSRRRWYGKVKTVFQIIAIILFIVKDSSVLRGARRAVRRVRPGDGVDGDGHRRRAHDPVDGRLLLPRA